MAAKRPRRDKRRSRNREALIQAAIELVIAEGPAGLTPLRITDQARLHKSTFHAHFKDATECLQAVALHVHNLNLGRDLRAYHAAFATLPVDLAAVRAAIGEALRAALPYANLYRLFARCHHDDSPLGETLRETLRESNAAWTQTLWQLALMHGVKAEHLFEIQIMAEHLVAYGLFATTRLIEGQEKDIPALAARLQRYNRAIVTAELRRMLGLTEIAGDEELLSRQVARNGS